MTKINTILGRIDERAAQAEKERQMAEADLEAGVTHLMGAADNLASIGVRLEMLLEQVENVLGPVYSSLDENRDVSMEDVNDMTGRVLSGLIMHAALNEFLCNLISEEQVDAYIARKNREDCLCGMCAEVNTSLAA